MAVHVTGTSRGVDRDLRRDLRRERWRRSRVQRGDRLRHEQWPRVHDRLRTWGVALTLLVVVLVAVTYLSSPRLFNRSVMGDPISGVGWLRLFAVFALSFFPGWLLVRFLALRGPALWTEYVVNLHRLGVDRREYLPAPPRFSEFYPRWRAQREGHGLELAAKDNNLYLRKFEASFGAVDEPGAGGSGRAKLSADTAFPVVLVTGTCAAGWTAILAAPDLYSAPPLSLPRVLAVAFAGSYLFVVQMLIRRYFQNDLKSSAYVSSFVRIITVLITVTVLYEVAWNRTEVWSQSAILATAFIVGFFPMAGIVFLKNASARLLGVIVGSLESQYPLSQLDGLNLWYETRLMEEGIEDMAELVNANIVDILLHTRVPAGRLVDWLDQAHLFLHLPPVKVQKRKRTACHARDVLRRAGVTNATSLLTTFGEYTPIETRPTASMPGVAAAQSATEISQFVESHTDSTTAVHLPSVVRILKNSTALTPVLNWRQWGSSRLRSLEDGQGDHDEDAEAA